MLKEKIIYTEGLPVNVTIANIEEYPIHFHDDIEIAFILEGEIILKNGYYNFDLKAGDIFILNDREIHSFTKTDKENTVMMLQLDNTYFSRYYDNFKNSFFVTDLEDEDESMEVLRKILSRIIMQIIVKGNNYEHNVIETAHNLIGVLMSDFQYFAMEDGRFINEAKNKGNKILAGRMNRITDFLYENYSRRLTLNEVAENEHLSIFYLSHVIKKATGLSFQELLSFIRVEESEKLVLGTNKKIGTIAEETGFSAVRYYIKYFTKWYGMHPAEYRKLYTGKVSSREILAKYKMMTPTQIKKLIKKEQYEIYKDFESHEFNNSLIINFDINNFSEDMVFEQCIIKDCLKPENMKPATLLFRMFKDLNEEIVLTGNQYAVSRRGNKSGKKTIGLSILVYNINQEIFDIGQSKVSTAQVADKLKQLSNKTEILLRIEGLNGSCKISRIKLTKENIICGYDFKLESQLNTEQRDLVVKKWGANPNVSETKIAITDTLTIQSNLEGLSGELILIDSI